MLAFPEPGKGSGFNVRYALKLRAYHLSDKLALSSTIGSYLMRL